MLRNELRQDTDLYLNSDWLYLYSKLYIFIYFNIQRSFFRLIIYIGFLALLHMNRSVVNNRRDKVKWIYDALCWVEGLMKGAQVVSYNLTFLLPWALQLMGSVMCPLESVELRGTLVVSYTLTFAILRVSTHGGASRLSTWGGLFSSAIIINIIIVVIITFACYWECLLRFI